MSFHLKELERAGLITARREARSIVYTADYGGLRGLIEFLMKDCCAGLAEICAPPLRSLTARADGPPPGADDERTVRVYSAAIFGGWVSSGTAQAVRLRPAVFARARACSASFRTASMPE